YNGQDNNATLLPAKTIAATKQYLPGSDRSASQVDSNLFKGILSAITYPTGGQTKFTYELNDYTNLTGDDQYSLQPEYVLANSMINVDTISFDIPVIDTPAVTF